MLTPELRGRTGQIVSGRYQLLDILGSGGQGVVYRALDRMDGDHVALKVLGCNDPDACERMFREALVMSQLQGTAAVRVLHQARTQDGVMALVMELLQGEDLQVRLVAREKAGIVADKTFLRQVFEPIVQTLEAAHERGIVHRDIKAENVFLVSDAHGGGVRLLDFGFAKLLRAPAITAPEVVAGSPSYFAPEVWKEGSSNAGTGVDVYALGVAIFRTLAGRLPFEGDPIGLMRAALDEKRPSLRAFRPDLSPDVDAWVSQALAIRPQDRFQRVTALWRAIMGCF